MAPGPVPSILGALFRDATGSAGGARRLPSPGPSNSIVSPPDPVPDLEG